MHPNHRPPTPEELLWLQRGILAIFAIVQIYAIRKLVRLRLDKGTSYGARYMNYIGFVAPYERQYLGLAGSVWRVLICTELISLAGLGIGLASSSRSGVVLLIAAAIVFGLYARLVHSTIHESVVELMRSDEGYLRDLAGMFASRRVGSSGLTPREQVLFEQFEAHRTGTRRADLPAIYAELQKGPAATAESAMTT